MAEKKTAPVDFIYLQQTGAHQTHHRSAGENELAQDTELFVFSDAAKKEADRGKVQEIRDYVAQAGGFFKVTLIAREENYGLARNVIEGVTEIIERYGTVIVLEDDLVTNRYFLRFMNDALSRYEKNPKVTGVTGFPICGYGHTAV